VPNTALKSLPLEENEESPIEEVRKLWEQGVPIKQAAMILQQKGFAVHISGTRPRELCVCRSQEEILRYFTNKTDMTEYSSPTVRWTEKN
jgi:hypothetical protein